MKNVKVLTQHIKQRKTHPPCQLCRHSHLTIKGYFSCLLTHFFSYIGERKKRFQNLKKRYNKKKNVYKNATLSGAGSKEANAAADA